MPTEIIVALIGAAAVIIAAVIGQIRSRNSQKTKGSDNSQIAKGNNIVQVMNVEEDYSKSKGN